MNKKHKPKIGLALGSGGARGLAHIGVLKVLKENNLPIDFIAGASVGSIIGAYYATKGEILSLEKKIVQLTKKDFVKLIDISSPKRAIISGNKIMNFLGELIGDKSFSDTKIPLTIIATDMYSGEEVQIRKGKLIDAIRASVSMPGIFPPAELNGKLFLDGGIVNPTPVNVVKQMGADIVIGVDLTMKHPVKIKNPSIIDTLMRSFEILRTQTTKLKIGKVSPDMIIIQTNKTNVLDMYKFYDPIFINSGEKAAKKALPKIKKLIEKVGNKI